MIGETLGGYRITRKVGEGGMGAVYEAEHVLIGRRAAIKCLLPELTKNEEASKRFLIEARAAASINHPSLVEIFEFGRTAVGGAYIVMEYLDGEDLASKLKRETRLELRLALSIAREVASALAVVHQKGIIHRDLKPDNLFLLSNPVQQGMYRVKVLDFGIAKLTGPENKGLSAKTRTGSVLGTPSYMSPEQCRGHGKVDWRSDIYALGCIAYEMLTGHPPFRGTGYGEVLAQHIYEPPPPLRTLDPTIPEYVEQIFLRALVKNPEHRTQSMEEIGNQIEAFLLSAHAMAGAAPQVQAFGMSGHSSGMGPLPGPPPAYPSHTPVGYSGPPPAYPAATPAFRSGPPPAAPPRLSAASALVTQPEQPRSNTTMGGTASEVVPRLGQKRRTGLAIGIGVAAVATIVAIAVAVGGGEPGRIGGDQPGPLGIVPPLAPEIVKPPVTAPAPAPAPTPTEAAAAPAPEKASVKAPPAGPAKVHVSLRSDPAGATVLRDGKPVGKTPFDQELSPSPARLSYVLRLDGHKDAKVELPGEQGGNRSVKLAALAAPPPEHDTSAKREPGKRAPAPSAKRTKPIKDGIVDPFK